jgi:prevent-host-death family protein
MRGNTMTKTVGTREARDQIGALIDHVNRMQSEVIVTSHGKPRAVLISFTAFEDMRHALAHKRGIDAPHELKAFQDRVRASGPSPRHAGLAHVGVDVADDPDAS